MGSTEPPEFNEDTPRISKRQECALDKRKGSGTDGGWDLTSHDKSLRTSNPSSPFEEPNNRILRGYYGVKELNSPGPLHTEHKAHVKEKETPKDEQRESKLPKDIAEDNPVLSQPRS